MDNNCPLCGPEGQNQSAGAILGKYARDQRNIAQLYQTENEALLKENASLRAELKITMDAMHTLIAPRSLSTSDLNMIQKPLELPGS